MSSHRRLTDACSPVIATKLCELQSVILCMLLIVAFCRGDSWNIDFTNTGEIVENNLGMTCKVCSAKFCATWVTPLDLWLSLEQVSRLSIRSASVAAWERWGVKATSCGSSDRTCDIVSRARRCNPTETFRFIHAQLD